MNQEEDEPFEGAWQKNVIKMGENCVQIDGNLTFDELRGWLNHFEDEGFDQVISGLSKCFTVQFIRSNECKKDCNKPLERNDVNGDMIESFIIYAHKQIAELITKNEQLMNMIKLLMPEKITDSELMKVSKEASGLYGVAETEQRQT